jgi:putative zinc finger protein
MTCHETRERLSELLDEALPARERADVEGHLAGCPECRRELERLRATVSLLARVEPVRAPAGFVDRVMAAVRPVPWYRRLAAWIFLPLSIKLPAEAAAMALVAIMAVYLFQRDAELRQTVRPELQATPPRAEAPAPREGQPAPSPVPPPFKAGKVEREKGLAPAREKVQEAERATRDEGVASTPSSPSAMAEEKLAEKKREGEVGRLQKEGQAPQSAAPPALSPAPAPAAPAQAPPEYRPKSQDASERPPRILAPAPLPRANRQTGALSLSGQLAVKDRRAAEQGLAELLARVGGSEISRRGDAAQSVIDVMVPEARYAEFARGLTTLGVWSPEPHPTVLSTEPAALRVTIRISE